MNHSGVLTLASFSPPFYPSSCFFRFSPGDEAHSLESAAAEYIPRPFFLFPFCMCPCMFLYARCVFICAVFVCHCGNRQEWVCTHVCACRAGDQRSTLAVSPYCSLPGVLRLGLSVKLRLRSPQSSWPAKPLGPSCSASPQLKLKARFTVLSFWEGAGA